MASHLRLKLCSFSNTVIVLLAVWCCWPKTLSLFYQCTHSISEMPTNEKVKVAIASPAVAACLCSRLFLSCFVLCCAMRLCCRTWPVSTLSRSIDWQLWCCMKSRFDWWGLWPSGSLAGGALRECWLYGRSVLLNGAHFELSALLSGWQWTYNQCTSSSVCAILTARTETLVGFTGGMGCKLKKRKKKKYRLREHI